MNLHESGVQLILIINIFAYLLYLYSILAFRKTYLFLPSLDILHDAPHIYMPDG